MNKYLPCDLKGKTVVSLNDGFSLFESDLTSLNCNVFTIDDLLGNKIKNKIDAFTLDATLYLSDNYLHKLKSKIKQLECVIMNAPCYSLIPFSMINYNWDVHNSASVTSICQLIPSSRWVFDHLLSGFAVRDMGQSFFSNTKCYVMHCRLMKLNPLLLCIMAESGVGKTSLVRQLTRSRLSIHVSSDYILSDLIMLANTDGFEPADSISLLITEIQRLGNDVWSKFFRHLDNDLSLLSNFLEIIHGQLGLDIQQSLLSLDIDIRNESSQDFVNRFFTERGYMVWSCTA